MICISSACPRSRVMFGCYQRHLLPGRQQGSVSNIYVEFHIAMSKYHFYASYFCHGSSKNFQCGSIETSRSNSEVEAGTIWFEFCSLLILPGPRTVQKYRAEVRRGARVTCIRVRQYWLHVHLYSQYKDRLSMKIFADKLPHCRRKIYNAALVGSFTKQLYIDVNVDEF